MADTHNFRQEISAGRFDAALKKIYVSNDAVLRQRERYADLLHDFDNYYNGARDIRFFSAPGRTEVGGNHTDHNNGKVLAAAINLDVVGAAAKNDENIIRVKSKKYRNMDVVDLSVLDVVPNEAEHSSALIRGTCAKFRALGYQIGGFDAVTVSDVLRGSGLSSSAAFEVLIGTILNYLYNDGKISPVVIAQTAQYAENEYYKKPCGLMDQTASSVGGFVTIDFKDNASPVITPVDFDFNACGHALCIVDTRADHADLSEDYAAIRYEMNAVAGEFGQTVLRFVDEAAFYKNIGAVKKQTGERAVLRAMHFFEDNKRVDREVDALRRGDFEAFKQNIIESGYSSYMYNQNVYTTKKPASQPVALALALSEQVLRGKGAWRVHGGGFAGTIQAFVPLSLLDTYKAAMEGLFGEGACHVLQIRAFGGTEVV
ncbi:MAG: galactokinase [Oscillospiraceae bacterium]|jgi:galactokinase|nr:galactokinase [Oscillospiraceae bacterium]